MATDARDPRAMRDPLRRKRDRAARDLPPAVDELERKRQAVLVVALLMLVVLGAIIALAPS